MITVADMAGRVRHRWRNYWLRRTFKNGEDFVRALGGAPEPTVAILRNGARIEHPPAAGFLDVVLECWYRCVYLPRGFYRPAAGRGPEIIVDAGANVGLFSIQMLRKFPAARIEAFEPFPDNFQCLKQNLSATAPAERWRAHPVALAAATGHGSMKRISERSLDHVLNVHDSAGDISIETLSLTGLLDSLQADRIGYLKVDIEGSERAVFEAAGDADFRRIDHIAAEYHDHIVPGSLSVMQKRFAATHHITIEPSPLPNCGMLYARRRSHS